MSYPPRATETRSHLFTDWSVAYATFGQRLAASLIDYLILIVPLFFLQALGTSEKLFATLLLYWLYPALMESGPSGATFGKKRMGIRVTGRDGYRISFLQATGRHFGKYLSCFLFFIGYFMVLWDSRRQALHDKLAGTLVVGRE